MYLNKEDISRERGRRTLVMRSHLKIKMKDFPSLKRIVRRCDWLLSRRRKMWSLTSFVANPSTIITHRQSFSIDASPFHLIFYLASFLFFLAAVYVSLYPLPQCHCNERFLSFIAFHDVTKNLYHLPPSFQPKSDFVICWCWIKCRRLICHTHFFHNNTMRESEREHD